MEIKPAFDEGRVARKWYARDGKGCIRALERQRRRRRDGVKSVLPGGRDAQRQHLVARQGKVGGGSATEGGITDIVVTGRSSEHASFEASTCGLGKTFGA